MSSDDLPSVTVRRGHPPHRAVLHRQAPDWARTTRRRSGVRLPRRRPQAEPFRRFLASHHRLLDRLRRWTLQFVIPRFLTSSQARFERALTELFAAPLSLSAWTRIPVVVRAATDYGTDGRALPRPLRPLTRGRARLCRAGFSDAYDRWLKEGDAAYYDLLSPLLREAWQRGDVRIVLDVLPHSYLNHARSGDDLMRQQP